MSFINLLIVDIMLPITTKLAVMLNLEFVNTHASYL